MMSPNFYNLDSFSSSSVSLVASVSLGSRVNFFQRVFLLKNSITDRFKDRYTSKFNQFLFILYGLKIHLSVDSIS